MTLTAGEASAWITAFSPDGKRIVAGYSSGMTRIWEVATRLPITQLAGNAGGVLSAQFSTDGSKVVTASEDGTADEILGTHTGYLHVPEGRHDHTTPA